MNFGEVKEKAARKPLVTVMVPATAWHDDWAKRPDDAVCIGVRALSEDEAKAARAGAAKAALDAHPRGLEDPLFIDAANSALMHSAVAMACCDPNDVKEPWEDFAGADDVVRAALVKGGVELLWDAIDRAGVMACPNEPEATDEEVDELHAIVVLGGLEKFPVNDQRRLRRLLGHVLRKLREANP